MNRYITGAEFKALVQDTTFTAGGTLPPEQATEFVDRMIAEQTIIPNATVKRMITNEGQVDFLDMAGRQSRAHVPGVAGDAAAVTSGKRNIVLKQMKVWFDVDAHTAASVTIEADSNYEAGRSKLLGHINRMGATAFNNDIEDLGINGDIASGDPFTEINDGWVKIIKADGHTVDIDTGVDYKGTIFPALLAKLPFRYKKNPAALRLFVNPNVIEAYKDQVSLTLSGEAYRYGINADIPNFKGVPLVAVPYLAAGEIILSTPNNFVFGINVKGIRRGMEKKVIEDTFRSVFFAPVGFQIANEDAVVMGYNIA